MSDNVLDDSNIEGVGFSIVMFIFGFIGVGKIVMVYVCVEEFGYKVCFSYIKIFY